MKQTATAIPNKKLTNAQIKELVTVLQERFTSHPERHHGIVWEAVEQRLRATPSALWSLAAMEHTGGEPDVVAFDKKTGECIFFDCAPESPLGRRSVCYDEIARLARKTNQPEASALLLATQMGVTLLGVDEYELLQTLGEFDTKTSSWLMTPPVVRDLGGALFGDRRYNQVFVYHNGAESYYAARGFRASLRV